MGRTNKPDALPEQEHETRITLAENRLRDLGYAFGSQFRSAVRDHDITSRLVAAVPGKGKGRPSSTYLVVPWEDALAWAAENSPRLVPTETTSVFDIGDAEAMRRHITALHATAAGHDGLIMVVINREHEHGWEQPGVTYEPIWPGQIDETIAAIQDAIISDCDPIILSVLFHDAEPATALGASVFSRRPDLLLKLPIPPRCLILHADDVFEATYLFVRPMEIGQVRGFGRTLLKATGGAVFPT